MNGHHFCLDDSPRFRMLELGSVDSTNSFLKAYRPMSPVEMTLVTAEHQSAGRGQRGNTWESDEGCNLLFSLLLVPESLLASEMFVLSEAMALSVADAVEAQLATATATNGIRASEPVAVKWPNDVYVGDAKVAGILFENELAGTRLGRCIIGCGVNVNQRRFRFSEAPLSSLLPSSVEDVREGFVAQSRPEPVSLYGLLGREVERRFVLEDIMETFTRRYELIRRGEYSNVHADYAARLYRRTGFHAYRDADGPFQAELSGVEPSGHLLLRDDAGRLRRYAFKEVSYERVCQCPPRP